MADIGRFITHIQGVLTTDAELITLGITPQKVYRSFLSQVKDPPHPVIGLTYEIESTDVMLDTDSTKLYVAIHSHKQLDTEAMQRAVKRLLHKLTYSDEYIIVYKCFNVGGLPTPFFDKELNHWETMIEFEVEVVDAT